MNIGEIDEDLREIIAYLNNNGFKPWASCDGVWAHHSESYRPDDGYIFFLKSEKIFDLLAAFLRDGDTFEIDMSNATESNPYVIYDNVIYGNQYGVRFPNARGENTYYISKIIKGIISGDITIGNKEKEGLQQLSDCLDFLNKRKSPLNYSISFNRLDTPFSDKRRVHLLNISPKTNDGKATFYLAVDSCLDMISERFGIPVKENIDGTENDSEIIEPPFNLYFTDMDIPRLVEIIKYIHSIQKYMDMCEWDSRC
jgi:hypothetical protein